LDLSGNRLRFGTNAEFLLADGIPTFENGVIKLDALHGQTMLGHIFGGIVANAPHTQASPSTRSAASNQLFEVLLQPALSGDFNYDAMVDAADYVVWRDYDGTPAGYDAWRTRFGETTEGGAGVTATAIVPEPGMVVMLIAMVAGAFCQSRYFSR
jgi:hypothetical protein